MNLLEINHICKTYGNGDAAVHALRNVSFSIPKGEHVAIVGRIRIRKKHASQYDRRS